MSSDLARAPCRVVAAIASLLQGGTHVHDDSVDAAVTAELIEEDIVR